MAKKVEAYIKLQVPAGQANPSPPVGPALGQHGVNIMEFCKAFNAATQSMEPGLPIAGGDHGLQRPQLHLHHQDAAGVGAAEEGGGLERAAARPTPRRSARSPAPSSKRSPRPKMPDLTAKDMDAAVRTIAGSARSMGLERGGGGSDGTS